MTSLAQFVPQSTAALVHPGPDTDAVACGAVIEDMYPDMLCDIRFSADPDPHWHAPLLRRFTMDIGGGPLDHHQLCDPRSTCAFTLTLEYFLQEGTPVQQHRAQILLNAIAPAIFRQDSTGRISHDGDARLFAFPQALNDCVYQQVQDEQSYRLLAPFFRGIYAHAVATNGVRLLPHTAQEIQFCMDRIVSALCMYLVRAEGLTFPRGVLDWRDLLAYASEQGSPSATAIDNILTPVVERYRTMGRITEQIDPIAHVLSLPHMLRCGSRHNGDHDELLHSFFAARVADYEARHHPERVLEHASVVVGTTGRVARVQTTLTKGTYPNGYHLEQAIYGLYPDVQLLVQDVQWRNPDGSLATYLCSIVRRPQSALVVPDYLNAILSHVPPAVCTDLQRWHQERWVCLTGGLKNEQRIPGPAGWSDVVLAHLDTLF